MPNSGALAPLGAVGGLPSTGEEVEAAQDQLSLTRAQRAAVIIALIGPEKAAPLMEKIDQQHYRAFARAFAHVDSVPKELADQIAEEFVGKLTNNKEGIKGGFDETRELLGNYLSSEDVSRIMDDIDVPGGESIWERLDRAEDGLLASYLAKQHPQSIAVVLTKINTEKASRVLDFFETDLAREIIKRLSKPFNIRSASLRILSSAIEREFLAPMRTSTRGRNPGEMIGAMMNNIMSEKRAELLGYMEEDVPEILGDVRKSMLTFQDIVTRVPPNAISAIIKEVEPASFLQAVKFGKKNAPESVEFIFANISQRMVQQYEEEIEALKPAPVRDAEAAQAEVMTVVREMAARGEVLLLEAESADEEEEGGEE